MNSPYSAKIIVAMIGILMMLTSCSLVENDDKDMDKEPERTYPEAFDFELSTVYKMKTEVEPPDSLNVDIFVTAVFKCPDNANCIVPDGIMISDSLDAESSESQMHLTVEKPRQFTVDEEYRLSLDLSTWPGNGEKRFILLGYSALQP